MASKSVLVLSIVIFCGAAKPENCPRCKVLPVGDGFASEFRLKASEKGVRLVYFNLKIGNDSYHPLDLEDEFLPDLWVHANSISEPMLSLPNDFDILSLGLLNYQVRSMDVKLKDQPSGCLASLNSSCQNLAVGRVLLEDVTMENSGELSHKTQVVCVAMIKSHWHDSTTVTLHDGGTVQLPGYYSNTSEYHCCAMHKQSSNGSNFIQCDQTVEKSSWLDVINGIVITISIFVAFYVPAFPLVLPNCVFSLQYECDKDERAKHQASRRTGYEEIPNGNEEATERSTVASKIPTDTHHMSNGEEIEEEREFPVDDASPMIFSTLLLGYTIKRLPFNIKLAILLLVIYPFPLYFQLGIYHTLKKKYINESIRKDIPISESISLLSSVSAVDDNGLDFNIGVLVALVLMSLVPVLFLRPRDFLFPKKITTEEVMSECIWCDVGKILVEEFKLSPIRRESSSGLSVADEIRHHLKVLLQVLYLTMSYWFKELFIGCVNKMLKWCSCRQDQEPMMNHSISRVKRALFILWVLFLILLALPFVLLYGVICLFGFLFSSVFEISLFSPTVSLLFAPVLLLIHGTLSSITIVVLCIIYNVLFLVLNCFTLSLSCGFITGTLVFVIVGLVLNYSIVTPYGVFVLVVTTNIYLCYANFQKKYMEVKKMILKWRKEISTNIRVPEDTIPKKLFYFVCDRALPIKSEFCLMLFNMVLILTFLFFVVYSFVVFGNEYNVSALFSTIAVFVSGVIPVLVQLQGLMKEKVFIGWKSVKINREIETAVRDFDSERHDNRNSRDMDSGPPSENDTTVV